MSTEQQDLLKLQTSAKNQDNNDYSNNQETDNYVATRRQIDGTPFWLIHNEEGIVIALGKYRMNPHNLQTEEQALEYLEDNKWNIILTMCALIKQGDIQ